MENHTSYDSLINHPFFSEVMENSMQVSKIIKKKDSKIININAKYDPDVDEKGFYCLRVSNYLIHLTTVVQQMEHSVHFLRNFSPTNSMKKAQVSRASHILWSIENYIIRTQTVYDRLLILVDRIFHIQNSPNRISHESIITNSHISRTNIPKKMELVRKAIKQYYWDRNKIIHEATYTEDDLRFIEAYTYLLTTADHGGINKKRLEMGLKSMTKELLDKKKKEFSAINQSVCIALSELFNALHLVYKMKLLEIDRKPF